MRIADGIELLEVSANVMGQVNTICPTLIWDYEAAVLIDTGYPGQLSVFQEVIAAAGVSIDQLTQIVITHQDIDHIGSLPAILNAVKHPIEVLANEFEKRYIEGGERLMRVTDEALAQLDAMPEAWRKAVIPTLLNPPKGRVDRLLNDGEVLPACGGLVVIDTPGHTPGHLSLYHRPSKTLIAGDALVVVDGQLHGPDPAHALDLDEANRSISKFLAFDIAQVICYHGGLFQGDVNARLSEIVTVSQRQA